MVKRGEQFQLFDDAPYTLNPKLDYHPDRWEQSVNETHPVGVNYHATNGFRLPYERVSNPKPASSGFHLGTEKAAMVRATGRKSAVPLVVRPETVVRPDPSDPAARDSRGLTVWSDAFANDYDNEYSICDDGPDTNDMYSIGDKQAEAKASKFLAVGRAVPYRNGAEDVGSTSYRAPRTALQTWRDQVLEDPQAHPRYKHAAREGYDLVRPIHHTWPWQREKQTSFAFDGPVPEGAGRGVERPGTFQGALPGKWKYLDKPVGPENGLKPPVLRKG